MLAAVGVFGAATIVFGLSRWMLLSLACLALLGAADMFSVYVRQSLIQLYTPDDKRGRVGAVSSLVHLGLERARRGARAASSPRYRPGRRRRRRRHRRDRRHPALWAELRCPELRLARARSFDTPAIANSHQPKLEGDSP